VDTEGWTQKCGHRSVDTEGWTLYICDRTGPYVQPVTKFYTLGLQGAALWGGTDTTAYRCENLKCHRSDSLHRRGLVLHVRALLIAAEFGRQRYSRVPKSVLVSPAATRLMHGVTWSQNSAAFHVYFLRHHITVNCTFQILYYRL
jgi:hypothetical protein